MPASRANPATGSGALGAFDDIAASAAFAARNPVFHHHPPGDDKPVAPPADRLRRHAMPPGRPGNHRLTSQHDPQPPLDRHPIV
jgi:hypothetical protein